MSRAAYRPSELAEREAGFVYFFVTHPRGDKIKIGYTTNPGERIATLRTASPVELRILAVFRGTKSDEAMLHEHFAAHRIHGEWFKMNPELRQFIKRVWEDEYCELSRWGIG
jgi:hypothetical protein